MAVCGIIHTHYCSWSYLANIKRGSIRYNHRIQDCFYLRTVKTGTVLWHRTVHNPYEWELPWKKGGSCGELQCCDAIFEACQSHWPLSPRLQKLCWSILFEVTCVCVKICVLHGERFNTDLTSSKQVSPYAPTRRQRNCRTPSDQPH